MINSLNNRNSQEGITKKEKWIQFIDIRSEKDFYKNLNQEKIIDNKRKNKEINNLYKILENESSQEEQLFNNIFWILNKEDIEEFKTFQYMNPEEFDQSENWYRKYEKEWNNFKAAKCLFYYIIHQRKDNNTTWPYNDLLYRHIAQNLLFEEKNDDARDLLTKIRKWPISGERKAIDDLIYNATLAFADKDIITLQHLQLQDNYKSLDQFNKNTIDAMISQWLKNKWEYKTVYGWLRSNIIDNTSQ